MQNCPLPTDIFRYILALDKQYLSVSSFLALRTACKQIKMLYTKQKYIDKYLEKVIKVENGNSYYAWLREYSILPNKELHGHHYSHLFSQVTSGSGYLEDYAKRYEIALRYGLIYHYYNSTYDMRYYLGKTDGIVAINNKLLGCEALMQLEFRIESITVEFKYSRYSPGSNNITPPKSIDDFYSLDIYVSRGVMDDLEIIEERYEHNVLRYAHIIRSTFSNCVSFNREGKLLRWERTQHGYPQKTYYSAE